MNRQIIDCSEMISNAYSAIEKNTLEKTNKFYAVWKKVVTKIKRFDDKNFGQKLYEHSSVVDIKNEILLVETDHSGWSQMMQLNSKFILNGLKMYVPEMNIKSLAFRTKGSSAELYSVNYEEEIKKQNKKIAEKQEKDEEEILKYSQNSKISLQKEELPPDILNKFESMKKSMLTKNKV